MISFDDLKKWYNYNPIKVGKTECLSLPSKDFPRSVTKHEFEWLRKVSKGYNLALEIATGTGVSTIAISIPVITVDCYIEEFSGNCDTYSNNYEDKPNNGRDSVGYKLMSKMISENNLNIEQNIGFSPNDIPNILNNRVVDFAFIDALHTDEALEKDVDAIIPYLDDSYFVAIHDLHCFSNECLKRVEEKLGEIKRVDSLRYGEFGFNMGFCDG